MYRTTLKPGYCTLCPTELNNSRKGKEVIDGRLKNRDHPLNFYVSDNTDRLSSLHGLQIVHCTLTRCEIDLSQRFIDNKPWNDQLTT